MIDVYNNARCEANNKAIADDERRQRSCLDR